MAYPGVVEPEVHPDGGPWPATRPAPDRAAIPPPLRSDAEIQGNILAGFNKDHQAFLFVSWDEAAHGRNWLTAQLPRIATNSAVTDFNKRFGDLRRNSGADPESLQAVWINVSFTADGVRSLAPHLITDLERHDGLDAGIRRWLDGSANSDVADRVGDIGPSSPTGWFFGGSPEANVHALVCVAADSTADLRLELARQRELAARHNVTLRWEQLGDTLPGRGKGHEHFGFKDGISQPGVWGYDEPGDGDRNGQVKGKPGTDLIEAGTFILGYPRDDGTAVKVPGWMFDGSFLVTRRLAQDVPGFWNDMVTTHAALPEAVKSDPSAGIPSADALAAKIVGRWRSGTPTDKAPIADRRSTRKSSDDNEFDFSDDLAGLRTPACAHIRKVYPRRGADSDQGIRVTEEDTKLRRIIRRGIPFGQPFEPTGGRGRGVDAKRGLLFQCYQASIEDQFVFLQQSWINFENFPLTPTGNDAVIGLASTVHVPAAGADQAMDFAAFVATEGSLFSLTPSISTLTMLAADQASSPS